VESAPNPPEGADFLDQRLHPQGHPACVFGMSPSYIIRTEMQVIDCSGSNHFGRLLKRVASGNKFRDSGTGIGHDG
jgi:hypothetical protein